MIYEFIDGLKAENELYNSLVNLAADKRSHIVKGSIEDINNINAKEEELVLKLKGIERKRNVLMADIASVLGVKTDEITVSKIIEALKGQPEEARALEDVRTELQSSLKHLKDINDENIVLINQSLEYAQFSINVMQAQLGSEPMTANYGGMESKGQSFFDAKQ